MWTVFSSAGRIHSRIAPCTGVDDCRPRIASAAGAFGLNSLPVRFIAAPNRNTPMLALGVIFAFVIIIGAINYFEFGSVD